MKKVPLTLILFLLMALPFQLLAQNMDSARPFRGTFVCKEANLTLNLDAYEESVSVPNMDFLGKLNGYMSGRGVYGVWLITSCSVDKGKVTIRLSNDTGSDAQAVIFTMLNDSTFRYSAVGNNVVKKAVGRKLVKIDSQMIFKRKQ